MVEGVCIGIFSMISVFTPLTEDRTRRLNIPLSEVNILKGDLFARVKGKKATVEIKHKKYEVVGISCGLLIATVMRI